MDTGHAIRRWWRERDMRASDRLSLSELRGHRDVCWTDDDATDPLVTIRITTYDRGRVVVDRAIKSALAQSHPRLEILVIGDGATPDTVEAVESIKDPRVRFVNLPRGTYPADPQHRWMVLGNAALNHGLEIAAGAWITPLDDDDEFTPDHVEVLLREAVARRVEFVYGDTEVLRADGSWGLVGKWPPSYGRITHGSILYSSRLRFFRYDPECWRDGEAQDWDLIRRMRAAGVRMGFVPHPVYRYYPARHTPSARATIAR